MVTDWTARAARIRAHSPFLARQMDRFPAVTDLLSSGDFDEALAINASLSDAWLNKGFLRIREGKGQEALPLVQKGIDNGARRQALAYFARGVAYEQAGDLRSAYNDLVKARQMEPKWALPKEWLAHYQVGR